ncbi:MAG: HAD family hydrolase [Muribaculaceae bacterium]|nr:HAD family hydrolase [Muribaculaceae bacterium]
MLDLKQLKRLLKQDNSHLPSVKAALVGDTATQLLATAVRGAAIDLGFAIDLYEADYNQVERQFVDPDSELRHSDPHYIIIFQATHQLAAEHAAMPHDQRATLAQQRLNFIEGIVNDPAWKGCRIMCLNYPEIDDTVYGNYANQVPQSLLWQTRLLNVGLMQLAQRYDNLTIVDVAAVQSQMGRNQMFAPSVYVSTEMVLSIDALPAVAYRIAQAIAAQRGTFNKCLILDLDNTLWGGVIGDDGLEGIQLGHGLGIGRAFTELQQWAKKLQQRGVILCVVSKNDEQVAKEPFVHHPDMVLRLDDIAVFVANWETKVDNIRAVQQVLNIGFDAMVFLDDNPFERAMVREHILGITVPELPDDPADYLEYLYGLNLFETASASEVDSKRTRQYQQEAQRVELKRTFANEQEFLASLGMVAKVEPFTPFSIPRVAQLTQRSNQFNLRTVRYSEDDVRQLASDPEVIDMALSLSDRFGDHGLIAVVVMRPLDNESLMVDTWLMSCRVLKRGMERFTLNQMVEAARARGYRRIVGEYVPTVKNGMVARHYPELGFRPIAGEPARWSLDLDEYQQLETTITRV